MVRSHGFWPVLCWPCDRKCAMAYKKLPWPNFRPWQFLYAIAHFVYPFVVLLFYPFCSFWYKNKPRLYLVCYHLWFYSSFISIFKYKLKLNSDSNLIKKTTVSTWITARRRSGTRLLKHVPDLWFLLWRMVLSRSRQLSQWLPRPSLSNTSWEGFSATMSKYELLK